MSNTFYSPSFGGLPNPSQVRKLLITKSDTYDWIMSTVTLIPYMIFSLFHALTFTRTTLMTQFLKPAPPATAGGPPQPPQLAKKLHAWVKGRCSIITAYLRLTLPFFPQRITIPQWNLSQSWNSSSSFASCSELLRSRTRSCHPSSMRISYVNVTINLRLVAMR